jgi:hypothetical protein
VKERVPAFLDRVSYQTQGRELRPCGIPGVNVQCYFRAIDNLSFYVGVNTKYSLSPEIFRIPRVKPEFASSIFRMQAEPSPVQEDRSTWPPGTVTLEGMSPLSYGIAGIEC